MRLKKLKITKKLVSDLKNNRTFKKTLRLF